jgi:two-component system, response regulator
MERELSQCSILVADDDADDRLLIQKAMKESGVTNGVHFLEDGQKLVDRLAEGLKSAHPGDHPDLPCLILLDLNMPRLDGRETLRIVKNHPELKEIPIVILSSSKNPEDVMNSYKEGANSFFTKPLNYRDLVELMGLLKTYWFQKARLPFEGA